MLKDVVRTILGPRVDWQEARAVAPKRGPKPQEQEPRLIEPLGPQVPQEDVLRYVISRSAEGVTSVDVADDFNIKRSAANAHLLRMLGAGLVERTPIRKRNGSGGRPEYIYRAIIRP